MPRREATKKEIDSCVQPAAELPRKRRHEAAPPPSPEANVQRIAVAASARHRPLS